ncbi:hypothetical protein Tco_0219032 [Tanacetum coccineum]
MRFVGATLQQSACYLWPVQRFLSFHESADVLSSQSSGLRYVIILEILYHDHESYCASFFYHTEIVCHLPFSLPKGGVSRYEVADAVRGTVVGEVSATSQYEGCAGWRWTNQLCDTWHWRVCSRRVPVAVCTGGRRVANNDGELGLSRVEQLYIRNASLFLRIDDTVQINCKGLRYFVKLYLGKFVIVFIDDIVIYSKSKGEHEVYLRLILELLKKEKLLGRFYEMRIHGYKRRFITNFLKIAKPLTLLTQKNKKFEWGDEQEIIFLSLKDMLCDSPILRNKVITYASTAQNHRDETYTHSDLEIGTSGNCNSEIWRHSTWLGYGSYSRSSPRSIITLGRKVARISRSSLKENEEQKDVFCERIRPPAGRWANCADNFENEWKLLYKKELYEVESPRKGLVSFDIEKKAFTEDM